MKGGFVNGPKVIPICAHCMSPHVVVDAYAQWDKDQGEWSLSATFDHFECVDCEGETTVLWRLETEAKERAD